MARNSNSQHTEVTLSMSARQAQSTLTALQNQADDLRKRLQAAVDAGNAADAKKLQQELNRVNGLMRRMQTETANVEQTLQKLDQATPNELRKALSTLQRQIRNVSKDSPQFAELAEKIRRLKEAIQETNEAMQPQPGLWERIKNAGTGAVAAVMAVFAALGRAKAKMDEYVQSYAGMQEEMAGVSKYSGLATEDVETLNDEFKRMDTRTTREGLNRLAQDAGRLGKKSVKDILGFVRAADQVDVALDDLGDGATLTLSKLTGLFGIEAEYGTEQALLKTGSVINDLSQNCSASAGYIAEFTSRMASAGKQANLTIPQIMAYAAVMDESAVNVEQSSTAISKLIIHLMQEPAKYAKAAGLELQSWYATMQTDANEGFLQFVDALKKKGGLDQLAPLFKEMGENGIGAMNALGLLANRIDLVRAQQDAANESFELGTSITNEFSVANNTVAARLDKNKNAIHDISVSIGKELLPVYNLLMAGTRTVMQIMAELVKVIMDNKTVILMAIGAWMAYKTAIALAAAETKIMIALEKGYAIVAGAARAASLALSIAYNLLTGNINRATAATRLFNTSMRSNVIGIVIALIGTLVGSLLEYAQRMNDASKKVKAHNDLLKEYRDQIIAVDKEGERTARAEIKRLQDLYTAATNEAKSKKERIAAAQELIRMYPEQFSKFTTEQIMLGKSKKAYDDLTTSIINNAKARAAAEKVLENERKVLDLEEQIENQKEERKTLRESRDAKNARNAVRDNKAANQAQTMTGAIAMQGGSTANIERESTLSERLAISDLNKEIGKNYDQIIEINKSTKRLTERFQDNESFKSTYNQGHTSTETPPTPDSAPTATSSAPPQSAADKREAAKRAREAEAAARRAEKKQKEEFKQGLKAIEAEWEKTDAMTIGLYRTGAISLSEYQEALHDSEMKMFDDKIDYYKKAGMEEDEDVAEFRKKKEQADLKYSEKQKKSKLADVKREQQMQEDQAQMDYATPGTKIYKDEEALQERLFRLKVYYMYRTRDLYELGSDEYARITDEIAQTEQQEQIRKQKQTADLMMKYSKEYRLQDVADREKMEISALNALHQRGLLSEKEYQEALKELRERYRKERNEQEGKSTPKKKTTKDYTANSEWGGLVAGLYEALSMELDKSEDKLVAWSKKASAIAQAAFAVLSSVGSQISAYTQAQVDYETAKIEKSYEARIKAAGNNSKKTKQLEEEKEAEINKIKAKANKENFQIQIATAIAQTAANAISAYGSVIGIPVVGPTLAPIAAALAVAAGMVQVATIRKQAQTSALQGYSEGGFTGAGRKDEEAGVVHRGEWVAPAWMVNDRRSRPMIEMLERARLTNSFPSITAADVSRTLTAPAITAGASGRSVEILSERVDAPDDTRSRQAREKALSDALERLSAILDGGISANVSVSGRTGIDQASRRYNQLVKNKNLIR